jgi:hypothetical protein
MVLDTVHENWPLCRAFWVLAGVIAFMHSTIAIFVSFTACVPEVKRIDVHAARHVGDHVLMMHDPPVLRPDGLDELRELVGAHSWLAKVVHLCFDTILN